MWNQPYLETCCRSALHRVSLCGVAGRPPGLKDGPCLERLAALGLARARSDGCYELTPAGSRRHASEILHRTGLPVRARAAGSGPVPVEEPQGG
jgi:hypothetical protein